ncbi:MAG: iron-sulfur cluster assembly scaffold protein, partial [Candidatus Aureabacteria bacterium]|nr:iron-sulfur cluster assembly scaffold protein [Candidatus Auribacterota bacterium]
MTMADKKEEEELELPPEILKLMNNKNYFGQMNDPTSSAYLQGPCGDYMEFYLVIEQQKIIDLKYYTEGCSATRACGAMV